MGRSMVNASSAARPAYRTLWVWLLLGWVVSYADRQITGPVVSYMINNDLAFVQGAGSPYSLGGLIGSLFFAGYILTQFPGGYLGDKFGHRTIIVISIVWAGVATLLSGLMTALLGFVALRVITGLGEGTFYSNDRTVIVEQTPFEKRSLGMGVVITGLSIGLTLGIVLTPPLIQLGDSVFGTEGAWRMPFFVWGVISLAVGYGISRFFKRQRERDFNPSYLPALRDLGKYSIVSQASGGESLLNVALTAAFNAGAGILGFPAGGWLADYAKRKGWGRKPMLVSFTLITGLLTVAFGLYIIYGGQSLFVMGVLLFFQALFFFALQPISHALTADLVNNPAYLGAAFGMWNLIGEIGAVLSPAISGVLRDTTGSWNTAVMVDAGIILGSIVLLLFVRESRAATAGQPSEVQEANQTHG